MLYYYIMTGIDENKLAGGKRKNGHSSDCTCHICENMINKAKRNGYTKDAKKKELQKKGAVKKNGHSPDCGCPICKNMMAKSKKQYKKQKGGDEQSEPEQTEQTEQTEQSEEPEQTEKQEQSGGKKKKGNGHKANCKCPICKNMKKSKKGGEDPDIENQKGDIEEGGIKGESETTASDSEYDDIYGKKVNRYGHLMSFLVKGDAKATRNVFDALTMIWRATDLGRIKSIATIPAISTHSQQGEEGRKLAGIPSNLIRLCVGGEHPEDIIKDLDRALSVLDGKTVKVTSPEYSAGGASSSSLRK